jgi:hypothetical protein
MRDASNVKRKVQKKKIQYDSLIQSKWQVMYIKLKSRQHQPKLQPKSLS